MKGCKPYMTSADRRDFGHASLFVIGPQSSERLDDPRRLYSTHLRTTRARYFRQYLRQYLFGLRTPASTGIATM